MEPKIKTNMNNTIHKDGTISFWCIHTQTWRRQKLENLSFETLSSFNEEERTKIDKAIDRLER